MMIAYNVSGAILVPRSMDRGKRNDRTPAPSDAESLTGSDVAMNGWIQFRALHGGRFLLTEGEGSSECKVPRLGRKGMVLPPTASSCTAAMNGS